MSNNPRILVAAPTYDVMKYCEKKFLESIKNFDYPAYDILLVDNSKDENYSNHLNEIEGVIVLRTTEGENNLQKVVGSRNKILEYAAENDYDYIFMLDSDVICPREILKKLLGEDKDIVSGLYFGMFNVNGKLQKEAVAYKILTEKEFEGLKEKYNLPEYIQSRFDLKGHLTKEETESKKLMKVDLPCAGCMLIKRNVFEKVRYSLLDTSKYGGIKTDDGIGFFTNCNNAGFQLYCDTSLVCEHLIEGKFRVDKEGIKHHPMYD